MYVLINSNRKDSRGEFSNSIVEKNKSAFWHGRLGHPSFELLKHVKWIGDIKSNDCEPFDLCCKAKQHRVPFPVSNKIADNNFDLLHMDVWGLYKEKTLNGAKYFLTIVDDHSKAVWTYLISHKDIVPILIKKCLNIIYTQFDCKVKMIRIDNGIEFINQ